MRRHEHHPDRSPCPPDRTRPGLHAVGRRGRGSPRIAEHRRRGRQPAAHAEGHRGVQGEEPDPRVERHVHECARAAVAGQDQGDAGGGALRHRPRADGHRRAGRRHRAEPVAKAPARQRGGAPRRARQVRAGPAQDAGSRAGLRPRSHLHAGRPAARIQPGEGQRPAEDARPVARVVQGAPEQADLCAPGELGPRPHVPDGAAVRARRQESAGPDQRLGQDLGVPETVERLRAVLPGRHVGGDEGARRRHARHDRDRHRLGPQPARARHRAGRIQDPGVRQHDVGERRALHGDPEGGAEGKTGRAVQADELPARTGAAGDDLRRRLLLSGPGGEGRDARDGARPQPGSDQEIRPPRIREAARRPSARAAAQRAGDGRRVPEMGSRDRVAKIEMAPEPAGAAAPASMEFAQ